MLISFFTVLKIMLSAVLTGMMGIHAMKTLGWVELYPKSGSAGMNIIGGLIFGVGFAVLGYCPGTIAGAGLLLAEPEPRVCGRADQKSTFLYLRLSKKELPGMAALEDQ